MEFISEELNEYAAKHTTMESEVLRDLNRYTQSHVLQPRMLSGHIQGRILSMISKMLQPKYILEIGTYTGYSAICMAEGLKPDGKLYTIDNNEELYDLVKEYIQKAGFESKAEVLLGDASTIIPKLEFPWDLVFIDADKENYLKYYLMLIDRLPSGAIVIADNVLWSGKILDEKALIKDEHTRLIHEFNEYIQADSRVENVMMPVRDGLLVIRKI